MGETVEVFALVLVGWLLLAPPLEPGFIPPIDAAAPISNWRIVDSFTSEASCGKAREARIASASNSLYRTQKILKRQRRRRLLLWAYLWECHENESATE
jgi:hypothetical protein